jgi:Cell division protein CrgA
LNTVPLDPSPSNQWPSSGLMPPEKRKAMPKSSVRKKKVYTPPADMRPASAAASRQPSPSWVGLTAILLILFGLAWLVTFYLSDQNYPVASWGYWNLGIGFASLVASLIVLSRWR